MLKSGSLSAARPHTAPLRRSGHGGRRTPAMWVAKKNWRWQRHATSPVASGDSN